MAPPATVAALLIALALVPGWLYLRLIERLQPRSGTSGLHQLLEVLAVGVATTGVSVIVVVLVPHRWMPFTLDVSAWVSKGDSYLRDHVRSATWSLALVFALAVLLACVLYWLRARKKPAEFRSQGNVWVHSLGDRPTDKVPYVGLQLKDGRLVEGPLHSYTFDAEPGKRDVALSGPIRVTAAGGGVAQPNPSLDRLIVPESQIEYITVIHVPAKGTGKRRRREP